MKNILLACGSGIATSTAVNGKISKILDENGYKGQYKISQCKISEAPNKASNYDFLISTTVIPKDLDCESVSGVCFLTGVNTKPTIDRILALMEK